MKIQFSKESLENFSKISSNKPFTFIVPDIISIEPKVKHMSQGIVQHLLISKVDYYDGCALLLQASLSENSLESVRYLESARKKLKNSLYSNPDNSDVLIQFAIANARLAKKKLEKCKTDNFHLREKCYHLLRDALNAFDQYLITSKTPEYLLMAADNLCEYLVASNKFEWKTAHEYEDTAGMGATCHDTQESTS